MAFIDFYGPLSHLLIYYLCLDLEVSNLKKCIIFCLFCIVCGLQQLAVAFENVARGI